MQPQAKFQNTYFKTINPSTALSSIYSPKYIRIIKKEFGEFQSSCTDTNLFFSDRFYTNEDSLFLKSLFGPFAFSQQNPVFTISDSIMVATIELRTTPVVKVTYYLVENKGEPIFDSVSGLHCYLSILYDKH